MKEMSDQVQKALAGIQGKVRAIDEVSVDVTAVFLDIEQRVGHLARMAETINNAVGEQERESNTIASLAGCTFERTLVVADSVEQVHEAANSSLGMSGIVSAHAGDINRDLAELLHVTRERLQRLSAFQEPLPVMASKATGQGEAPGWQDAGLNQPGLAPAC